MPVTNRADACGVAAAGDAPLDRLERVRDQRAVDDAVDRTPEPDQLGAPRPLRRTREPAEQLARTPVVEQDPPVEVADHYALVELGHQCGKLVALLRHLAARLGHQPRHVHLQGPPRAGEPVDGPGQLARRAPPGHEIGRRGIADQHPGRIREPRRRGHVRRVEPARGPGRQRGRNQPPGHGQHTVGRHQRPERRIDRRALARVERRPHQHGTEPQPHGQGRAGHEHCQHEAPVELHASMSRTLCISSRVENGLVT